MAKTSAPTSEIRMESKVVAVESQHETAEEQSYVQEEASDEAAMGRLSSMSLIASVTAGDGELFLELWLQLMVIPRPLDHSALTPDIKQQFVNEVERVGKDPLHWIRVEAAFAMGALAKVVPDEVVVATLVSLNLLINSLTKMISVDPSFRILLCRLPSTCPPLVPLLLTQHP
jgi:serine/threonine-protein phosphatase 4 regulatory subunit 1